MFFYVYVLQSKTSDGYYIGYTTDLIRRVKEHNLGQNSATKPYRPWRLIYYEACRNREDAKRREKHLKTTKGRRMVKARLKEYLYNPFSRFA
jgi:putative endonuclease